jgi:hypothetical protein
MPNWCSNVVMFEGKPATIANIRKLFSRMAKKQQQQNCGQLPPFIKTEQDWFFDIRWENEVLYYETRWAPNTEVLVEIARRYCTGFTHEYEESGNLIFGRAVYRQGVLTDTALDNEDFDLYQYDEVKDSYLFEGSDYLSDTEILETLLERKSLSTFKNNYHETT